MLGCNSETYTIKEIIECGLRLLGPMSTTDIKEWVDFFQHAQGLPLRSPKAIAKLLRDPKTDFKSYAVDEKDKRKKIWDIQTPIPLKHDLLTDINLPDIDVLLTSPPQNWKLPAFVFGIDHPSGLALINALFGASETEHGTEKTVNEAICSCRRYFSRLGFSPHDQQSLDIFKRGIDLSGKQYRIRDIFANVNEGERYFENTVVEASENGNEHILSSKDRNLGVMLTLRAFAVRENTDGILPDFKYSHKGKDYIATNVSYRFNTVMMKNYRKCRFCYTSWKKITPKEQEKNYLSTVRSIPCSETSVFPFNQRCRPLYRFGEMLSVIGFKPACQVAIELFRAEHSPPNGLVIVRDLGMYTQDSLIVSRTVDNTLESAPTVSDDTTIEGKGISADLLRYANFTSNFSETRDDVITITDNKGEKTYLKQIKVAAATVENPDKSRARLFLEAYLEMRTVTPLKRS